jgi:Uma2 family endonuclease
MVVTFLVASALWTTVEAVLALRAGLAGWIGKGTMMTVTTLPRSRPFTWRDLEAMPDDGHRYELIDGALVVTPAPSIPHQSVAFALARLLHGACPPHLKVLMAPLAVRLADDTELQPDILVARRSDLTHRNLPAAPALAVEVLSPSTRLIDINLKKARYEAAGCPSYWTVDPDGPQLTAWELADGAYVPVAHVVGDEPFRATKPFPVTVVPADLLD